MVAVPVLLGSLVRLRVGMLADRFGGRLVFPVLMFLCAIPAFLTPMARTYDQLLVGGFFRAGRVILRRWSGIQFTLLLA